MAGKLNIEIEQGATFTKTFVWKDDNGDARDLTGYSAEIQFRETKDSASSIYDSDANSDISLGTTDGTITWTISAPDTASMSFDRALWALELNDGSGVITRLLEGWVDLNKEIVK